MTIASSIPSPAPSGSPASGLPVPRVGRLQRITTAKYTVTTSDRHGRLADRSLLKAMGWAAGQNLTIRPGQAPDTIVIRAETAGPAALSSHGFLRLPSAVRYWCHIREGDRVLIAGYPDSGLVVVCTLATLDDMINSRVGDLL